MLILFHLSSTHCAVDLIVLCSDQSDCGCCWAVGAAGAASDRMCIATNGTIKVPLSAQETCFCGTTRSAGGCMGASLYEPWTFILSKGVVTGGQFNGTGPLQPPVGQSPWCSDFSLPHCHHHGNSTDPYPSEGSKGCPKVGAGQSPVCPKSCDAGSKRTMDERYGALNDSPPFQYVMPDCCLPNFMATPPCSPLSLLGSACRDGGEGHNI